MQLSSEPIRVRVASDLNGWLFVLRELAVGAAIRWWVLGAVALGAAAVAVAASVQEALAVLMLGVLVSGLFELVVLVTVRATAGEYTAARTWLPILSAVAWIGIGAAGLVTWPDGTAVASGVLAVWCTGLLALLVQQRRLARSIDRVADVLDADFDPSRRVGLLGGGNAIGFHGKAGESWLVDLPGDEPIGMLGTVSFGFGMWGLYLEPSESTMGWSTITMVDFEVGAGCPDIRIRTTDGHRHRIAHRAFRREALALESIPLDEDSRICVELGSDPLEIRRIFDVELVAALASAPGVQVSSVNGAWTIYRTSLPRSRADLEDLLEIARLLAPALEREYPLPG